MSGIAAIIRFDGGPVEPCRIEKMTAAMHYRGVDGIAHWTDGPAALGHCMMRTTAESLEEAQPLANEDESLILVMDGWLSNWEELRGDLLARGARLRTGSDAELVLRAYEAWGEDCPKHIDGEYAFLVWDKRRREAYCARDHAGLRPLHYRWDGNRLIVASDIGGIMALPEVARKPNLGLISEVANNDWLTRDETAWRGVMRLVPATWMRFGGQGVRSGRYWSPPVDAMLSYPREADYFEHYRDLLTDCVRRASRSHVPLACEASGGLDSSAVYCIAHELQRTGRLLAPGMKGYTFSVEDEPVSDEIEYARAVADHTGTAIREIPLFLPEVSWYIAQGRADADFAPYPNAAMSRSLGEALVGDGCRVSLNGQGGDEFIAGSALYYAENISLSRFPELLKILKEDASEQGWSDTLWYFLRYGLAHKLPRSVFALRRKIMWLMATGQYRRAFWLSPELQAQLRSRQAAYNRATIHRMRNPARRAIVSVLQHPMIELTRDRASRQHAQAGFEPRSPMYARAFIEFALALPERMRCRGSAFKYLHSEALSGILPEKVAKRRTKAHFAPAFDRPIDGMREHLIHGLPELAPGCFDAIGIAKLISQFQAGIDVTPRWEIWGAFSVESLFANVPERPGDSSDGVCNA